MEMNCKKCNLPQQRLVDVKECPICRRKRENSNIRKKLGCPTEKKCGICEEVKSFLLFNVEYKNIDKLASICVECGKNKDLVLKNRNKLKHTCTKCLVEKNGYCFPVMKNSYTTMYPVCKVCLSDYRYANGVYSKLSTEKSEKKKNYTKEELLNILYQRRSRVRDPRLGIIQRSKQRAKKKGFEHNITKDDIILPTHCPILGTPLVLGKKNDYEDTYSLDRIDNDKGYIKGNVQVISKKANSMKNSGTKEELLLLAKWIMENLT